MLAGRAEDRHRTGEGLETCALGWPRSTEGHKRRTHLGLAGHLWESLKKPVTGDKKQMCQCRVAGKFKLTFLFLFI